MRYFFRAAGLLVGLAAVVVPAAAQSARGTVIYVDVDATGAETGANWADAFTDLQDALVVAQDGDELWVAEGTYTPTSGSDRTVSFVLVSGVALYGGFDGTEQDRDERDWVAHETILSGDVGVAGDSLDNAYHILMATDTGAGTALDGFTVQHGYADGATPPDYFGAGLYAEGGAVVLRNDVFRYNATRRNGTPDGGGGVYAEGVDLTVEDVLFERNVAQDRGGGLYSVGGMVSLTRVTSRADSALAGAGFHTRDGEVSASECVLTQGKSRGGGGAWYLYGMSGTVSDCVIEGTDGVGVFIVGEGSPRFVRVTIRGNRLDGGDGGGAIIRGAGAAPVFEDGLFEGNTASRGAAVKVEPLTSPLFLRTTFRENVAGSNGAISIANATLACLFCHFERNRSFSGAGIFALGSAVTILASVFVGNTAPSGTPTGGALLFTGSTFTGEPVVVASSLFAGNEANEGGAISAFGVGPGEALVVNSTFAGNEAREAGGAIYASNAAGLEIRNSILWGNTAPTNPEVHVAEGAPPVITQSIIEGGYPSGTAILDADPQFVRSPDPGADGRWGTEDDDYGDLRLSEGSPAVDYGLAEYLPPDRWDLDGDGDTEEPLPIDLAGNPRVIGEGPDLGAYEGAVRVGIEPGTAPEAPNALRVWPNPASSVLHIQADADEVVLYDVLGREVLRLGSSADQVAEGESLPRRVGVSGLAPGVYVVRAGDQAVVVTVRR